MTELLSVEKAWERLKIHLEWADRFWLLYVFTDDPRVVDILRSRAQAEILAAGRPFEDLRPKSTTRTDVLEVLEVLLEGRDDGVAWVDFVRHDAPGSTAWHDAWQYTCMQLNQRRELLRRVWSKGGIVLATTLDRLDETPGMAPDLWTIRSLLLRVATLPAERDAGMVAMSEPLESVRVEPVRDPELAGQAVDRARRMLEAEPSDAALTALARVLDTYGTTLGSLGRREEALAITLEAVDIMRSLARANPDAFMPDLGRALNNLGIALSSLGRHEEATAATLESVQIWRSLRQANPDAVSSDLAAALNNLSIALSSLRRREEAMAASFEAVQHYRTLAKTNPDPFLPDLAMALNNLGISFDSLGQRREAMAASLEALQHYRTLAKTNPDPFLSDLAMTLGNLGNRLSSLGRHEEAMAASLETVQHYRTLAEANPTALLSYLAAALNNLGADLSSLGRREEAVAASLEAMQHYRTLAETSADAFLPDLAITLNNLGAHLSSLGQYLTARDHYAEGLHLILPYFVKLPAAHAETATKLARQLRQLEEEHDVPIPEPLAPAVALILDVAATEPPTWSQADLDRLSQLLPSPATGNR